MLVLVPTIRTPPVVLELIACTLLVEMLVSFVMIHKQVKNKIMEFIIMYSAAPFLHYLLNVRVISNEQEQKAIKKYGPVDSHLSMNEKIATWIHTIFEDIELYSDSNSDKDFLFWAENHNQYELLQRFFHKFPRITRGFTGYHDYGFALVHNAAEQGNLEMLTFLDMHLSSHIVCSSYDDDCEDCETIAHIAARRGHLHIINYIHTRHPHLLSKRKQYNKIKQWDDDDSGPIHLAAKHGHTDVLQFLVTHVGRHLLYQKVQCYSSLVYYALDNNDFTMLEYFEQTELEYLKDEIVKCPSINWLIGNIEHECIVDLLVRVAGKQILENPEQQKDSIIHKVAGNKHNHSNIVYWIVKHLGIQVLYQKSCNRYYSKIYYTPLELAILAWNIQAIHNILTICNGNITLCLSDQDDTILHLAAKSKSYGYEKGWKYLIYHKDFEQWRYIRDKHGKLFQDDLDDETRNLVEDLIAEKEFLQWFK